MFEYVMADSEIVHIVDGTLVKCDHRSDLTKPEWILHRLVAAFIHDL